MGGLISVGEVEFVAVEGDSGLSYFRYVPTGGGLGAPLFVSVHGRSRNAARHAELFAPFAERYGVVLIAPLFSLERFPDYNCLGREGRGDRADLAFDRILSAVEHQTGARGRIYLFGYSGGAQFAHRYMMVYPERVARVAAGAGGWYTFPDTGLQYPYGIGPCADLSFVSFEPERFLRVPCLVLVGEQDVVRGVHLNQDPKVDTHQGTHRLERGQRWVAAMNQIAAVRGFASPVQFQLLHGVGHSFADCMTVAGMGTNVFAHLFGPKPAVPA